MTAVVRDLCQQQAETGDKGGAMVWKRLAHATVQLMSNYGSPGPQGVSPYAAVQPALLRSLTLPGAAACAARVWDVAAAVALCGFKQLQARPAALCAVCLLVSRV